LPKKASTVLDIGCGIAAIDALISAHFQHRIKLHLLDKSAVNKHLFYGFKQRGAFYNSLSTAKQLLLQNDVPAQHIILQEADQQNTISTQAQYDIVLSLISWGYHYPIETYLQQVCSRIADDGVLIIDVRKGTNGEDKIRKAFSQIEIITNSSKQLRIVASKKKA
jgi:SAM-dependent methyltransferase